ncbi:MAG: ribosomal protein S19 (BS19) [Parcubacteria group bacterium Gr01-1014_31]|nr:MAG: ribosomal protein S19 (BS19) [Parcubacteria group bacterium Gr01-1014_31]
MARSLKKGPYINQRLLAKLVKRKPGDRTVVKTWDRACTITPAMVGFTIGVHNGRAHVPVQVVENMVGHRLGEFAQTRKFTTHGGRMAKEQQAAQLAKEEAARKAAVGAPAPAAGGKPAGK